MEPTKPATSRAATPVARRSASAQLLASAIGVGVRNAVTLTPLWRPRRGLRRRRGPRVSAAPAAARQRAFRVRYARGGQRAAMTSDVAARGAPEPACRPSTVACCACCAARQQLLGGARARSSAASKPTPAGLSGLVLRLKREHGCAQARRRVRARLDARAGPPRALQGRVQQASDDWHSQQSATPRDAASSRRLRGARGGASPLHPAQRCSVARRPAPRRCDHGTAEEFHVFASPRRAACSPPSRAAQL